MNGGYLVIGLTVFLLPFLFFFSPSYWSSTITKAVWGLRFLAIAVFLFASFRLGVNHLDCVALTGTLGTTFFYETGYFLSAGGYLFGAHVLWGTYDLALFGIQRPLC